MDPVDGDTLDIDDTEFGEGDIVKARAVIDDFPEDNAMGVIVDLSGYRRVERPKRFGCCRHGQAPYRGWIGLVQYSLGLEKRVVGEPTQRGFRAVNEIGVTRHGAQHTPKGENRIGAGGQHRRPGAVALGQDALGVGARRKNNQPGFVQYENEGSTRLIHNGLCSVRERARRP